jgi:hypothetical protein
MFTALLTFGIYQFGIWDDAEPIADYLTIILQP